MSSRDDIVRQVAAILDRPVRWAPAGRSIGSYDGCERTLEVFDADAREQLGLLRRLRAERSDLERAAGGPVVIVFHTPQETRRLYGDTVCEPRPDGAGYAELLDALDQWMTADHEGQQVVDPDDIERFTFAAESAA